MLIYPLVPVLNDRHSISQPEFKLEDLISSCTFLPPPPPKKPDISFKFNKIKSNRLLVNK
jgi:hypothetical protein